MIRKGFARGSYVRNVVWQPLCLFASCSVFLVFALCPALLVVSYLVDSASCHVLSCLFLPVYVVCVVLLCLFVVPVILDVYAVWPQ